jgi:hypothetical protein
MATLNWRSRIAIRGINPYVLVDAHRARQLRTGWRKPMPVRVQVNYKPDVPWRVNLMPVGDGSFYLYLAQSVRQAAGVLVGDLVRVRLWFDHDYRGGPAHPMPAWFRRPLNSRPRAKAAWDRLTPSRQKEILRYFAALKTPSARARNVQRALLVLSGESGRFMARDWNG